MIITSDHLVQSEAQATIGNVLKELGMSGRHVDDAAALIVKAANGVPLDDLLRKNPNQLFWIMNALNDHDLDRSTVLVPLINTAQDILLHGRKVQRGQSHGPRIGESGKTVRR